MVNGVSKGVRISPLEVGLVNWRRKRLTLSMVFLDRFHGHPSFQKGLDSVDDSGGTREGGDTWDVMSYRLAPDGHFIRFWFLSARGVDDEVDLPILNPVNNVWSALSHLEYALNSDPIIHQDLGCSLGGDNFKTKIRQFLGDKDNGAFILVHDADENSSLQRNVEPGAQL